MTRDDYFLALAATAALAADCRHRQVGAVIIDEDGRVIATGYNHPLNGDTPCSAGGCPRGLLGPGEFVTGEGYEIGTPGYCINVHAEADAILDNSRWANNGCTLYCTETPCHNCTQLAWSAGIAEIVTPAEVISRRLRYARTVT